MKLSKKTCELVLMIAAAAGLQACDKGATSSGAEGSPSGLRSAEPPTSGRVALPETDAKASPPLIGQGGGGRGGEPARETSSPAPTPSEPAAGGSASFGAELASLYGAWSAEEKALIDEFGKALTAAIAKEGMFTRALEKIYAQRAGQPIMSRDGALTEDADALVSAIQGVETHGLDPKPYELPRLAALLDAFTRERLAAGGASAPPSPPDAALWKFLLETRQSGATDLVSLEDKARAGGYSDADLGRLSEARKHLNALLAGHKALNATLAELDAFLAGKLVRWVFDMRFYRRAHPFLADKGESEALKRVGPEMEKLFLSVDLGEKGAVGKLVLSVVPRFPDYEPTREALARYREYAAKYPQHIELPKEVEKLGPGKSGELVKQLEERLVQEQLFSGAPTGKWSTEIEEALNEYQETHQMKPIGKVDKLTRVSLNKTFTERAALIALSLQRYRESDLHQSAFRFGEVPMRARVNIPSMEARFYIGTELARRHRVVVGNNDTETDAETGKKGKLNQTRLITAEMQTVVLNPVWNVPKRIKEQELDLMLMDEPDYYEKHNFKVEMNPDGTERVVQQPGPGNALGVVKFLFPNQFSIYMHDTPKKKLFDRPVRAFSHGCMRTENPVDLARWLLVTVDKEMTEEVFDETLAAREERHFALNPRIPISTDYITTAIDEAGRIVFLADVYGYDRDYFEGKTPYAADKDLPLTVVF